MAATVAIKTSGVAGNRRTVVADVTCDSSYPTGGYASAAADLGFTGGTVDVMDLAASSGGYVAGYDYTNGKIKLFRQTAATSALVEVPNTTNVATEVIRVDARIAGV